MIYVNRIAADTPLNQIETKIKGFYPTDILKNVEVRKNIAALEKLKKATGENPKEFSICVILTPVDGKIEELWTMDLDCSKFPKASQPFIRNWRGPPPQGPTQTAMATDWQ